MGRPRSPDGANLGVNVPADQDFSTLARPPRAGAPMKPASRRIDAGALWAAVPLVAVIPVWLVALIPFWFVLDLVIDVPYWAVAAVHAAGAVLLFSPPFQRRLLTALVGARKPEADEGPRLQRAFDEVIQAMHLRRRHFAVGVIDADELNAFACGGHLVIVTSYAARRLDHDELTGVLAHELCHHLGSHTVALSIQQWLSLPIAALARIGTFLHNVSIAAADTFGRNSPVLGALGRVLAPIFQAAAWLCRGFGTVSELLTNVFGRSAEFEADRRVVAMGYGRNLGRALRRTVVPTTEAGGTGAERPSFLERIGRSHPPARTRIARIEAALRRRERHG